MRYEENITPPSPSYLKRGNDSPEGQGELL